MELQNKVALITGGTRMGEAIACALAERGCDIALTYHDSKGPAQKIARKIEALGQRALILKADLTNPKNTKTVISKVKSGFKRLDFLVHLASIYERKSLKQLKPSDWDASFNIHLKSAAELSLQAAPLMRQTGGGRIVLTSDWTAASGRPRYKGYLPYYAAKSGVIGLTEGLALELAPEILVNTIAPGPILPPKGLSSKESAFVVRETPLKRWGGAEEIAKAVLFLIETDFVTGECIRVDGGRHLY